MNGVGPSLPAEIATTTPSSTALSISSATAPPRFVPKSPPSDMLITSTRSEMSPSPLGSIEASRPASCAAPGQDWSHTVYA